MSDPLRLAIVEDDPIMQLGLERFFSKNPQFAIVAQESDGYSGITTTCALQPDLVIMDVGLPRLDGIAATHEIKKTLPQVKVVMLTSHDAETEIIASLTSGADAYCIKGTRMESLLRAIAAAQDGGIYLDPQIARTIISYLSLKAPTSRPESPLSPRELEVLRQIVDGRSDPEIATSLHMSLSTVKGHVRSILTKLAVDNRVQAAVMALRSGLV